MMTPLVERLKPLRDALVRATLGADVKDHRVPFGPIAGSILSMRPTMSIRMFLGFHEPVLARAMKRLIRPGDVVYDVGAHVGYFSVMFGKAVGPSGRVCAFELLPGTAELLERTLASNSMDHCSAHAVGLADVERKVPIMVGQAGMGTSEFSPGPGYDGPQETCRIRTMDAYREREALPPPTVLKIDVEGAEVSALRGAANTIADHRPILFIEVHSKPLLVETLSWLSDVGRYLPRSLAGRQLDVETLLRPDRFYGHLLCTAPDCRWHATRLAEASSEGART